MSGYYGFESESAFNRFTNLDNIEWHLIDYLAKSESKFADYLWKILAYNTEDCLSKESLTYEQKMKMIYVGNGEASGYRVFFTPFIDDSWEEQTSMLHLYVDGIVPQNHLSSVVNIAFECIVHNKVSNILGDASVFNDRTNPSEIHNGIITTPYKSRSTEMLKSVLACLNGEFVSGVGVMQFNHKLSDKDASTSSLWNGKKFFGHKIIMSTLMSGASDNSNCGY